MKAFFTRTAGLALFFAATLTFAAPKTIVFSHVVAEDTPKGKMAWMFKRMVEKRLSDHYTVEIYANGSLMGDSEVVGAVSRGEVHLAAPSLSKLKHPKLQLFDLPFLFPNMEAVDRFQKSSAGQSLLQVLADDGVLGLGYLHNGLKQLTSDSAIQLPEDADGKSFRIMNSKVLVQQFHALNAEPIPLAFRKVYQALADGQIQGQENTWSNIYSNQFFHHQQYVLESNHGLLDYMIITNRDFWQNIPREHMIVIANAMKVSIAYGNAVAKAKSQNDRTRTLETGEITLVELTDTQKTRWQAHMRPVWQAFEAEIGADLIDAALNAANPVVANR